MATFRSRAAAVVRGAAWSVAVVMMLAGMLTSLHGGLAYAQAAPNAEPPAARTDHGYDVILIKPNKSGSGSMDIDVYETTFDGTNVSLKWLLASAFGIRENLISGLPAWAASERWDIRAKVVDPDPAQKDRKQTREESEAGYRARVQSILRERFQLKTHMETATAPVYDLVVAKGGSKLKPADKAEEGRGDMGIHNQTLTATAVPVKSLLQFLGNETGRNVQDKTGLSGTYDMVLKWSREDQSVSGTDNGAADKPPILFTAVEEQLGLKLVPDKGTIDTLVVDSVAMPTLD